MFSFVCLAGFTGFPWGLLDGAAICNFDDELD